MRAWFSGLALTVLSGWTPLQDKNADPDLLFKKEMGISVQKPAKNDEWEFKDHLLFTNSLFAVSHKVDRAFIEVFAEQKSNASGGFDVKGTAEAEWKKFSTGNDLKDCKKVQEIKTAKIPNGGANNPMAYLLDMTCKDKGDRVLELKIYYFVGKENQYFYKIFVGGDEGMAKKHQKFLDLILGSIRIFKIPK